MMNAIPCSSLSVKCLAHSLGEMLSLNDAVYLINAKTAYTQHIAIMTALVVAHLHFAFISQFVFQAFRNAMRDCCNGKSGRRGPFLSISVRAGAHLEVSHRHRLILIFACGGRR